MRSLGNMAITTIHRFHSDVFILVTLQRSTTGSGRFLRREFRRLCRHSDVSSPGFPRFVVMAVLGACTLQRSQNFAIN